MATPLTVDSTAFTADSTELTADMTELLGSEPALSGGGASGSYRYPIGNLDLETWRKRGVKIKTRIALVQEKIQEKRDKMETAKSLQRIDALKKEIAKLNETLLVLLAEMDELKGLQEDAEVIAVYMAYRTLH